MEDIYMKGYLGRRAWCSEKVHFKPYFYKYSKTLSRPTSLSKTSDIDILQQFVPQSNQLSQEELANLTEIMKGEQLTTLLDEDVIKKEVVRLKKKEWASDSKPSTSSAVDEIDSQLCSTVNKEITVRGRENRISSAKNYREVVLDATEKIGPKNLVANKHFLVSFRIHDPFTHSIGDTTRPAHCSQQIDILGHQPLTALKDKIICETDFQDTRGDTSDMPDGPVPELARDKYLSSMFYIDNTFYIDTRDTNNEDYSKPIRDWGRTRGIEFGGTQLMESTNVEDLEIRLGYPYLFMHQGCCEHLVVVSDARLLSAKDSLYGFDYPLMTKLYNKYVIYCMTCSRFPAKWIIRDSDRMAHDPSFQCKDCFKLLHYIGNEKIGNFKAYQYRQRSVII